jgi:hypothetical protein
MRVALSAADREHGGPGIDGEGRAHAVGKLVREIRRLGQFRGGRLDDRERGELDAALPHDRRVAGAPSRERVLADGPAARQRQGEQMRDLLGFELRCEAAGEVENRAELLDVLVQHAIGADRLLVRPGVGDAGRGKLQHRLQELLLLGRDRPERGLAERQHADGTVGGADRVPHLEPVRGRDFGRERGAFRQTGNAAGECHPHLAALFQRDGGAGHQEPPHHGAEQMAEQILKIERGIQQPDGFEQGLGAGNAEGGCRDHSG